jgi:NIMA (never in mitosis gene a)-related kinase
MKDLLEGSADPIKLLENREEMLEILGAENLDCLKVNNLITIDFQNSN